MKRRNTKNTGTKKDSKSSKTGLGRDAFFIESESSGDEKINEESEEEEDEYAEETSDERRIRMAKAYLHKLELDKEDLTSDEEIEDPVAHRLQRDVQRERGTYQQQVAEKLEQKLPEISNSPDEYASFYRGHRLTPTCLALTTSDTTAYTGAKDASLISWDIETGSKTFISKGARGRTKHVKGHTADILAVAVSDDEAYLATAGRDSVVHVWDPRSHELIHTFTGHRDAVTSLSFRKESNQLFSGSNDRTIKIWNLDQMAYVETLFGHQAGVQGIDSLYRDRALTVGCDKTVRSWKVVEETQLMFRGAHNYSVDVVSMVNEDNWVTGGQDGILALWNINKKKPSQLLQRAHEGRWLSSISTLPFTDVLASGSYDGHLRFWKCKPEEKKEKLKSIGSIPMKGFINGIKFASDARFVVAAVGSEHRLGRWDVDKSGKNGIQIVKLSENLMQRKRKKRKVAGNLPVSEETAVVEDEKVDDEVAVEDEDGDEDEDEGEEGGDEGEEGGDEAEDEAEDEGEGEAAAQGEEEDSNSESD